MSTASTPPDLRTAITAVAEAILREKCSFFLGAGVSMLEGRQRSTEALKLSFITRYFSQLDAADRQELLHRSFPEIVSEHRRTPGHEHMTDQDYVTMVDRGFLSQAAYGIISDASPTTAHMLIADIGAKHVFTTNYDTLMESAYRHVGYDRINVVNYDADASPIDHDDLPTVHKLAGTAGSGHPNILAEHFQRQGYCDHLQAWLLGNHLLVGSLIYLGYSLRDDNVNSLIRKAALAMPERSYCVSLRFTPDAESLARDCGITLLRMDLLDFLCQLKLELLRLSLATLTTECDLRRVLEADSLRAFPESLRPDVPVSEALAHIMSRHQDFLDACTHPTGFNPWYRDYAFHKSLVEHFADPAPLRAFVRTYMKHRCLFATVQTPETAQQHTAVCRALSRRKFHEAAARMEDHLRDVARESRLWASYLAGLGQNPELLSAFRDHFIPLIDECGIAIEDRFQESRRILLLGGPGTGKSTFLKIALLRAMARRDELPIYINFETWSAWDVFGQPDIGCFLLAYLRNLGVLEHADQDRATVMRKAEDGRLLFVIDGLDLIDGDQHLQTVVDWIHRIAGTTRPSRVRFLVSARAAYYDAMRMTRLDCLIETRLPDMLDHGRIWSYLDRRGGVTPGVEDFLLRYHLVNFSILDMLITLSPTGGPTLAGVSALYEQSIRCLLLDQSTMNDLARLAHDCLVEGREVHAEEAMNACRRYPGIVERNRGESGLRFGKHPTIVEFLSARHIAGLRDNALMLAIEACLAEPRLHPVLFFLAGLLDDAGTLIRLLRPDPRLKALAIHCAGNAKHVPLSIVLSIVLDANAEYNHKGQIATPPMARALRPLGNNAVEAFSLFLPTTSYHQNLLNSADAHTADVIRSSLRGRSPSRKRYSGMLRRSAIDCLGGIATREAIDALGGTLRTYSDHISRFCHDETSQNEWFHNRWHVCIALARTQTEHALTYLTQLVIDDPDLDNDHIANLEALVCLLNHDLAVGEPAASNSERLRERITRGGPSLTDDFAWRRAHMAEAIGRAAGVDEAMRRYVAPFRGKFESLLRNDRETMVRYYACRALEALFDPESIRLLIDVAVNSREKYWVRHGALNAVSEIVDRSRYSPTATEMRSPKSYRARVRSLLLRSATRFSRLDPLRKNLLLLALRVLGRLGIEEDLPVFERYARFEQPAALLSGNIKMVARMEHDRCRRRAAADTF